MRKLTKTAAVVAAMATMVMGATVMTNAAELKNAWSQENGAWYYYNKDGKKVTNQWAQAGADWYFLGDDGKMVTNAFVNNDTKEVVEETDDSGDDFYFVDKTGAMVTNAWVQVDISEYATPVEGASKAWYFFGSTGAAYADQWVACGDDWYYINDNCKMADNQTVEGDDGEEYYLAPGGKMITGWYKTTKDDGKNNVGIDNVLNKDVWVYANNDGELQTGWEKINGSWYWLGDAAGNPGYVMLDDSFMTSADGTFYLKKNSGVMATGYTKVDDNEYYFFDNSKGKMATNSFKTINSKYYYFDANGQSVSNLNKKDTDYRNFYVEAYIDGKTKPVATGSALYADMDEAVANEIPDSKDGVTYKIYKLGTGTVKTIKNK